MTPEVVPPRVPQFNWIDLGLPSGTLWLDRMVGAPDKDAPGLFYQWGSIVGHAGTEHYNFSQEEYEAQGLNLITSDLNDNQDAARAYYGPAAKMPTSEQASELLNYTTIQREGSKFIFTSIVNGRVLVINSAGYYDGTYKAGLDELHGWLLNISKNCLKVLQNSAHFVESLTRYYGCNIIAVHS